MDNDAIFLRLKRIEGQIKGISKMYQQKRDCSEIIQQLNAVRSALREVITLFLRGEICAGCRPKDTNKTAKMINDLLKFS